MNKLLLLIAALDDLAAGEGDLTKRVGLNSKDEIGDMAAAVNRFVDKLQPIVREAGDVAQRTGVEIGVMTLRNAGADAAAQLQRDEVAQSLQALSTMADDAQSESQAMQAALRQLVGGQLDLLCRSRYLCVHGFYSELADARGPLPTLRRPVPPCLGHGFA